MPDQDQAPRRALIAGLGHMGSLHARVLSQIEGVEIVAAVDPDPSRREGFARSHAGATTHETIEAALARHELDFACVAAPPAQLAELGHAAIAAGVPVLIEKPLATEEDDALA